MINENWLFNLFELFDYRQLMAIKGSVLSDGNVRHFREIFLKSGVTMGSKIMGNVKKTKS